jgi:hypothetical protein
VDSDGLKEKTYNAGGIWGCCVSHLRDTGDQKAKYASGGESGSGPGRHRDIDSPEVMIASPEIWVLWHHNLVISTNLL